MVIFSRCGILVPFFLFFLLLSCFNSYSTDDAYISYRYATNFADGHGLVFNRGQIPVEGYTNFLWVLVLAGVSVAKLPIPETASLLGIFFSVGLLILMFFWASRQKELTPHFNITVPVLILAASPSLALWSHAGMETPMFTFFLVLGTLFLGFEEREEWYGVLSGLTFALAALTRPEGLLIGGFIIGYSYLKSGAWRIKFFAFLTRAILFLLPPLFHILWRKSYYGYWLPNTFYAKTTTGSELTGIGLTYLKGFLLQGALVLIILIILALFIRPKIEGLSTIILLTVIYSAYVVWVGGDWMPAHRLFLPIVPFLVMGASVFIVKSSDVSPRLTLLLTILVCVHLLFHGIKANARFTKQSFLAQTLLNSEPPVDILKELGLHLKKVASPDQVIAVVPAGKVPYYSGLQTIDMRGLCDSHISRRPFPDSITHLLAGHFKRDDDYVLNQKPDYIVITGAVRKESAVPLDTPGHLSAGILDEWTILKNPVFKAEYEEVREFFPKGDKDLLYYKRKENPDGAVLQVHSESSGE
jgi:arabinofuranosyltransferase